jgi:hypothetical protein
MSYCQGTISGKLSVLYGLMERSAFSAGHPGDVAQRVPLARMERQRAAVFGGADANTPRARSAVRTRCPLTGRVVNPASAMPPQPPGLMHMAHRVPARRRPPGDHIDALYIAMVTLPRALLYRGCLEELSHTLFKSTISRGRAPCAGAHSSRAAPHKRSRLTRAR